MLFLKKEILISLLGGFVLGKAGETIFGSETAKKVYTKAATGAFIAKDSIMDSVEKIQAEAMDIAAEARIEADKKKKKKDGTFDMFEGFEEESSDLDESVVEA